MRRHRYIYRDYRNTEHGDEEFVASPTYDNYFKDISDVKVVLKTKPKIQRRRVGTEKGRGSATPESSANRNSIRYANKQQSQLSNTPSSSTKRTSVRSANKQQIQILLISTIKARTKHTVSSTIHTKRQITTNEDDSNDNERGNSDWDASDGWVTARSYHTCRPNSSRR